MTKTSTDIENRTQHRLAYFVTHYVHWLLGIQFFVQDIFRGRSKNVFRKVAKKFIAYALRMRNSSKLGILANF